MLTFALVATIVFFVLAIIWSSRTWPNIWCKIGFWFLSIWGAFNLLIAHGFILKR